MPFNKKDHHLLGEVSPRFVLRTDVEMEKVFEIIDLQVKSDETVVGKIVHNQYYLDMPLAERHFWSPELRVSLEDDEYNEYGGDTLVRVTVGPQYAVWVLFIFMYSFLGLITLFGGMYGLSQQMLGIKSAWIWCFPVCLFLIFTVFIVSKTGQKIGRDHTLHLVSTLYHSFRDHKLERIES